MLLQTNFGFKLQMMKLSGTAHIYRQTKKQVYFKWIIGIFLTITAVILLIGCKTRTTKNTGLRSNNTSYDKPSPPLSRPIGIEAMPQKSLKDSLTSLKIDTITLKGKRKWIVNQFLIEQSPGSPEYDSLFDLNYDGYKDYVIGYYGACGTGIKNRIKVYFYDPKKKCYILSEQLSDLPNPTFYLKQKKITGFYIGCGGGSGGRLKWIKNKWVATKEFEVHNEQDATKWIISYLTKKKTETKFRSFQMVPPNDILETNIK